MLPTLLMRIQSLLDFIQRGPIPEQVATHLSASFCPFGEAAGVTISTLQSNSRITCDVATGFPDNKMLLGLEIGVADDRPGSTAMTTLQPLILNEAAVQYYFKDFLPENFIKDFQSAVIMPVGTSRMYGVAIQGNLTEIDGIREYVECIRSILVIYENTRSGTTSASRMTGKRHDSKVLTERQALIVELIKNDKTNGDIARELGYSESLIRQETIVIYRKLGISGRQDLQAGSPD
jgi:DNA-binding CsgD family transcriptional regulator